MGVIRSVLFRAYFACVTGLLVGAFLYGVGFSPWVQVAGEAGVVGVCLWRGGKWFP